MAFYNYTQNNFGVDVHIRHKKKGIDYDELFQNPLIHKRIDGSVIVPLNIEKLWGSKA